MALRTIREVDDSILGQWAKETQSMTPHLRTLIADMVETVRATNGVGLVVLQVGILKRFAVIECEKGELHVLINPEIAERDSEQTGCEGYLSTPDKIGTAARPMHVIVKALNKEMRPVTVEGEELLARTLHHEIDHLDGHLYTEVAEELYTDEELEAIQEEKTAEERE